MAKRATPNTACRSGSRAMQLMLKYQQGAVVQALNDTIDKTHPCLQLCMPTHGYEADLVVTGPEDWKWKRATRAVSPPTIDMPYRRNGDFPGFFQMKRSHIPNAIMKGHVRGGDFICRVGVSALRLMGKGCHEGLVNWPHR